MNSKAVLGKRGTMMLMLLVVIVVGSIIALQILPSEEMITRRAVESSLDTDLSQVREAFDLAYMAGEMATATALASDPIVMPDFNASDTAKKVAIEGAIAKLVARGYLRSEDVRDPTIPAYRWGSDYANFWQVRENVASNPSFELSDSGVVVNWKDYDGNDIDNTNPHVASEPTFLQNPQIDDYPYQNKLGEVMGKSGSALKVTR